MFVEKCNELLKIVDPKYTAQKYVKAKSSNNPNL